MTPRSLAVLFAVAATTVLAGCQTAAPTRDYTAFVRAAPRSILVVPPLNKSTDLNASYGFLSPVTQPLAERGYYVVPVAVVPLPSSASNSRFFSAMRAQRSAHCGKKPS